MINGLNNLKYLVPNWPTVSHIKAFCTTRFHGPMGAPRHLSSKAHLVKTNRETLKKELNLPNEPAWLNQIHSNKVVQAEWVDGDTEADASFTAKPGVVCVAMTADCLPILLHNQAGSCVAAVHAGWRGLANGVIENTITQMKSLPGHEQDAIIAWLGPAIGPEVFEVGDEVRRLFVEVHAQAQHAFLPHGDQKWLANIYELARLRLRQQRVHEIYGGNFCTYSNPDLFFSYRRDKEHTGNMASLIWISA